VAIEDATILKFKNVISSLFMVEPSGSVSSTSTLHFYKHKEFIIPQRISEKENIFL
jgi:hypothetical protein